MLTIILIFTFSFAFNFFWEFLHSDLYIFVPPMTQTGYHLALMAFYDALLITVIFLAYSVLRTGKFTFLRQWLPEDYLAFALIGFALSGYWESLSLLNYKWDYNELMPMIPFLDVGLTPFLQIGLTGAASVWLTERIKLRV